MTNFQETKTRSLIKSIAWRAIAFLNSLIVLLIFYNGTALENATIMNITGLILFYFHERLWNLSKFGKIESRD
jgi:uncharacterized membrane protein